MIADISGIAETEVSKKTNILIIGQQDYRIAGDNGMSSKQEKAFQLREKGASIEIMSEQEFIQNL